MCNYLKLLIDGFCKGVVNSGPIDYSLIISVSEVMLACETKHFRSIGCIVYKIVSSILADVLQAVGDNLIDDSQPAFVNGRNILDGFCSSKTSLLVFPLLYGRCFVGVKTLKSSCLHELGIFVQCFGG